MKFCPKCGTQLVDEAKFCSKCGALQPNMEDQPAPDPQVAAVQPAPVQPEPVKDNTQMTPRERYNYLQQNDERFRETAKVAFYLRFVGLIGLLFVIPFLALFLTPIGTFTGVNAQDYGNNLLAVAGKSYPYNFSLFELEFTIRVWANSGSHKLTPDNGMYNNIAPQFLWIFGFIFMPLIALAAIIGNPRSYILKTYEKDEGKTLYKALKSSALWLFGPVYDFLVLFNVILIYIECSKSEYKDGTQYLFGIVQGNKGGFTTCVVVTAIFIVGMIAASIVLRVLLFKRIKKYYK